FIFSNLYEANNRIILTLISTSIIGPIIEELMFRGLIYNTLKQKYSNTKSMLLTTILFSLLHFNLIQIIYTFVVGLILTKI
ncbi:MAG: CPBP family intramembrane glutamic endopeptidase, partial [Bacilli bacterium]